ncbi:MAG: LexA family protein [Clostridium sp.]
MAEDEYKRIFSKNLRKYMSLNNKTQVDLINDLGFNKSAVSTWCNGTRLPRMDKVDALTKYFGIRRSDLIEDKSESKIKPATIPVLGSVPAGIPIEAIQDIIDYEEIDAATAAKGEYFALQVKGSSMEPRIREGDIVIVRKQDDVESGEIAIVMVNGDNATIKRLLKYEDGIRLMPTNPAYEPLYFTNDEIFWKKSRSK